MNKIDSEWLIDKLGVLLSVDYHGVGFYNFLMNSIRSRHLVGTPNLYIRHIRTAIRIVENNNSLENERNEILSLTLVELFDYFLAEYLSGTYDFYSEKEEIYKKYLMLMENTLKRENKKSYK